MQNDNSRNADIDHFMALRLILKNAFLVHMENVMAIWGYIAIDVLVCIAINVIIIIGKIRFPISSIHIWGIAWAVLEYRENKRHVQVKLGSSV